MLLQYRVRIQLYEIVNIQVDKTLYYVTYKYMYIIYIQIFVYHIYTNICISYIYTNICICILSLYIKN